MELENGKEGAGTDVPTGLGYGEAVDRFRAPREFGVGSLGNTETSGSRERDLSRLLAARRVLLETDVDAMSPEAQAGFLESVTRNMFGVPDLDGTKCFGSRASDKPRENIEMLRRFARGENTLDSDEDKEFDAAAAEDAKDGDNLRQFEIAQKRIGQGAKNRMFWSNARPGGLLDWIDAWILNEGDEDELKEAFDKLDYRTMEEEDQKRYRDATIGEFLRQRASRSQVAAIMRMTNGMSDRAGDILVNAVATGDIDRGAFERLDGDEQVRVASAVNAVRGELKRGRILFMGFDTRDAEGDTNTGRLMLYDVQQSLLNIVPDVWSVVRGGAQWAYAKTMLDGSARKDYFDRIRRENLIDFALEQAAPEEEGKVAAGARGFAANAHFLLLGGATVKGAARMGRALDAGEGFGRIAALNAARAARANSAAKAKIAATAARAGNAEKALQGMTAGKTALEIDMMGKASNLSAEALAYRRMVSAANRYEEVLRLRRAGFAKARGDWMKGAGLFAAGETATFASFAMEYLGACDAAGISREDSIPLSISVGVINGAVENIWVPGFGSTLDSARVKSILGGAFMEAIRTSGARGLSAWTSNFLRTAGGEAARVTFLEGFVEEGIQQVVIEHGKAMAEAFGKMREEAGGDPEKLRWVDYGEAAWESIKSTLPDDWRTYSETVADMLPTAVAFGVMSPVMQGGRQTLRNRARRKENAASHERRQAAFAARNEQAASMLERFAEIDERDGDVETAKARREQANRIRAQRLEAPTMAKGGGAASVDWDEGLVGVIQARQDARRAVDEHWARMERAGQAGPVGADGARAKGNRFAEAEAKAREILRTAEPGSDTTRMIADEFGVDPQTAEVVESWIRAEEEMKLYSPVAKQLSSSTALVDIREDNVATVLPGYVDGSFRKDESTGAVSASYTGADGKVRTIAYVSGDMGTMAGETLRANAAANSGFGVSYDARYEGREGYVPWSALSDMERERIVWSMSNGYRSGARGTFTFTDAEGRQTRIDADDVVYLANGRLADVGYAGSHATLETARHETWHSIWDAYAGTMEAGELKSFAESLGVDTSLDESVWRKQLDEAVAYQVEAYTSGHWVPSAFAARMDRFAESPVGQFVQRAARWITQDRGLVDPRTGSEYGLRSFMDAYQRGELRVPRSAAARASVNARTASVNATSRSAGAPVGVSPDEVRAQQEEDAAAAEASGEGSFSVEDRMREIGRDKARLSALSVRDARVVSEMIRRTPELDMDQHVQNDAEIVAAYKSLTSEGFARALEWCKSKARRIVRNKYIGDLLTSGRSVRSTLRHSGKGRGPLKILVFNSINEILENAVPFHYGRDGDKVFYTLAHRMRFDNEPYVCRLNVQETRDGNRTYTVEFSNLGEKKETDAPTKGRGAVAKENARATPLHPSLVDSVLRNILSVNGQTSEKSALSGVQKKAGVAYPDASADVAPLDGGSASFADDAKALISRRRPDLLTKIPSGMKFADYDTVEAMDSGDMAGWMKRRQDYAAAKIADYYVSELMKFGDAKARKAALNWLVRGTIQLPDDARKVEQALSYTVRAKGKANTDPMAYASPVAMMEALHEFRPKAKPIDPDKVPELSDRRDMGHGVVTYLVQDDRAGQEAMRRVINTHWGEDANPWCLLQGDGHGNLSDGSDGGYDAAHYWKHYGSLPKRVAFRNGKLLAFMATDAEADEFAVEQEQAELLDAEAYKPEVQERYTEETGRDPVDSVTGGLESRFYEWLEEQNRDALEATLGRASVPEQWWDRKDSSHDGIPLGNMAVEGDPFGRFADFEIQDGEKVRQGTFHRGERGHDGYVAWHENGMVFQSVSGKVSREWLDDGTLAHYRDGDSGLVFSTRGHGDGAFVANVENFKVAGRVGWYDAEGRLNVPRVTVGKDGSMMASSDNGRQVVTFDREGRVLGIRESVLREGSPAWYERKAYGFHENAEAAEATAREIVGNMDAMAPLKEESERILRENRQFGPTVDESARDIAFSVAADKDLMDAATKANNAAGKVPLQVMMQALDDRRRIYRIFSDPKLSEDLGLPPDEMGKTSVGNASYGMTMENSTICTRTLGYEELADLVAEWLDRPLTAEEALYVAQQAMNFTDKPQCLYCYVAMDRMGKREFYGTYVDQRDAVLKDVDSGMPVKKAYARFLDGRKDTRQMKDRFTMWVNLHRKGAELIGKRDLASTRRMTEAAEKGEAHRLQVRDAERYAQSAAWAKKKIDYHAYNGEILRWKQSLVDSMNRQFGLRFYSFSDYTAAFVLENMQQITDASVRGLKGLGYTKELDFVDVFAETGMNINISTFGFEDEKTGAILCDGMQGADWAEARKRRDMYGNVGITFVATNDRQVEWALDQDWIDTVIPYHLVRTGDKIAKFMGWTNYKSMQEDVKTGDWQKGDKKAIFPHEHNNDRATYFRLLEENHLAPRFAKWTGHRNYMKLVNETRRAAKDTPAMQPVFDADAALRSIETMRNRGGYFEHIGVHAENTNRIAKGIAKGIREGAKPVPAAAFRPGGGSFSVAGEGAFSAAFPAIGNMSADDVLVAYTASRIAIGKTDRPSDRSVNLGVVKRELKALHPDWDDSRIARETERVARDAQTLAGSIRADLGRGVSQAAVLRRLPDSMKATFGRAMRTQARKGAEVGGYAEKAEAELAARKARIVADAVSVQTGVAYKELENAYGLDLSKTMLNIATNPSIRRDADGNIIPQGNGARTVEESGAAGQEDVPAEGAAEGRPVDARVQAAVADVVAKSAEQRAREKSKPDRNDENRRNAAGHAAEEEDEISGTRGLEGADPVAVAVQKHGVDMEDPRQMALFVVELARRWWIDNHGLAKDANPWSDPVAVQFLRRTAQGVYGKLVEEITYSRGRDTATRKVGDFVHVPTVAGLMTEMTLVGSIINRNMIRETQKQMCERLDLFLREKLGASGRFKADNEELRRRVPAEIELRARYMRHAMWLTPDAAAEEAAELQRELDAAAVDFAAEGHDVDQSRVSVEITRKLNILREFGALQYRPIAQIEAAFQWWQDAERGGSTDIAQAFAEREVRTRKAAAILARAFANAKKAFAAEGRSFSDLLDRYAQSHMAFTHLLRDLMRYASPAEREEAERIVSWLELEIQKGGTRAASEKRRHADAFAEAVERIYGKDFAKAVADLGKVDERFARFMTRIDGKPVEPTRGRAIQLMASLLQVGRKVEVQDPSDPSKTVVQWVGGYHDNIAAHHREGQAAELRALLSPADLNLVSWLGHWYEQNRSELSEVCEDLFGVGVYAETSNYMPVKMLLEDQGLEKGAAVGWSIFPKALMPRVRNERDFDTREDVLGMFMQRMEEGAQWKAFANLGLELRGIFGRAELQGAVVSSHGRAAKDNLLSFITDILAGSGAGVRSKGDFMAYIDAVRGWAAIGALGGNIGVMLKQTTSIPAFGFEVGLANTARYMATAFTPEGMEAMAAIWNSEERANRWNLGNSEAVANALSSKDTSWLKRAWKASMITNKLGDSVPALVVGQGIYRDALARGMSQRDAMAYTWMLVERTQQSSRIENQPQFQRRFKAGNVIYQFLSTQLQYLNYELRDIRAVAADPSSAGKWGRLANTLAINHFLLSSAYYWMGQLWRALLGQEPPDDQLKDWVVSMLMGPWGALYAAGITCTDAVNTWVKGYRFGQGGGIASLQWLSNVFVRDPHRLVSDILSSEKTFDDVLEDLWKWASDFNATVRDVRKVYKHRVDGESR